MSESRSAASFSIASPRCGPGNYNLVSIRERDIEDIRIWRNAQISVLRQKEAISREQQKQYFYSYFADAAASANPKNLLFSLLNYEGQLVAYGGIVHIQWSLSIAELSFLASNEIAGSRLLYENVFRAFLDLIEKVAFVDLGLRTIYTETFSFRVEHMGVLESCGYKTNHPDLADLSGVRFDPNSVYHGKSSHNQRSL